MVAVVNACLSFWASPPAGDEDDLIVDHRTIARAYLRGWFFFAARPAHRDTSAVPSGAQLLMYKQAADFVIYTSGTLRQAPASYSTRVWTHVEFGDMRHVRI